MTAYYEPIAGPSTLIWDGGIFVNVKNGEPCETAGPRQSNLFLKCDKTVKTRPTTVQIAEKNPSTGQGTTCNYWFDPIAHEDFCPGGGGGGAAVASLTMAGSL